jgi:hypothetical protein
MCLFVKKELIARLLVFACPEIRRTPVKDKRLSAIRLERLQPDPIPAATQMGQGDRHRNAPVSYVCRPAKGLSRQLLPPASGLVTEQGDQERIMIITASVTQDPGSGWDRYDQIITIIPRDSKVLDRQRSAGRQWFTGLKISLFSVKGIGHRACKDKRADTGQDQRSSLTHHCLLFPNLKMSFKDLGES